jgi:hypothetical protein
VAPSIHNACQVERVSLEDLHLPTPPILAATAFSSLKGAGFARVRFGHGDPKRGFPSAIWGSFRAAKETRSTPTAFTPSEDAFDLVTSVRLDRPDPLEPGR